MGTYAATTDVDARLAGRPASSASTKPTSTQVGAWIDEAEAMLTGALAAGDCTTPVTDTGGIKIMRSWACDYAEGRARMAYAAAAGDGTNKDGESLIEKFDKLIDDIIKCPAKYDAILSSGGASDNTRRLRGYVLDNADSKTVSDGDFDPVFTMSDRTEDF